MISTSLQTTQPIRLIATDLDGTLIHSSGIITTRNREALERARRAGIHVAINTGRRHSYALRALRPIDLPPEDAVISSNGAVVRTVAGDLLWRGTLSLPIVHRLLEALKPWRNALVFTFDLVGHHGADVPGALLLEELDTLHGSIRRWMETNAASIRRVTPLENAFSSDDAVEPIQAMLCGKMERMHSAEKLLKEQFAEEIETYRTEYPGNDLCILDIMPRGSSKGAALLRLAALHHILPAQTMAIGDNWNDVPMLDVAGVAVVLGNAPAALQAHARVQGWQIGTAGDEDGVALAIDAVVGDLAVAQQTEAESSISSR